MSTNPEDEEHDEKWHAEELDRKVARGYRLAIQLAMHLDDMGGASECTIPIEHEGEEFLITVERLPRT